MLGLWGFSEGTAVVCDGVFLSCLVGREFGFNFVFIVFRRSLRFFLLLWFILFRRWVYGEF